MMNDKHFKNITIIKKYYMISVINEWVTPVRGLKSSVSRGYALNYLISIPKRWKKL